MFRNGSFLYAKLHHEEALGYVADVSVPITRYPKGNVVHTHVSLEGLPLQREVLIALFGMGRNADSV